MLTTPDQVAELFHATYERLAPEYGYATRAASAVPWDEVPLQNRQLMTAVADVVMHQLNATLARPECACQTAEKATHRLGDEAFCAVTNPAIANS